MLQPGAHKTVKKHNNNNSKAVMEDVGILCELCDTWYHAACEGVSDEAYRILSMIEEIHWFCKKCNSHAVKMLKMIKSFGKLQDRVSSLEEHKMETDKEIKKIKDTLEGIESVTVKQEVMSRFEESQTDTEEEIELGQDMTKKQQIECNTLVYEAATTTERAEGLCGDNVQFRFLTLLNTNVRGLMTWSTKKDQLQKLLDDYKIGIMGITETWGKSVDSDSQFDFTGFKLYRKDRSAVNNKKDGGVALYVTNDLRSVECTELNEKQCESVWCKVFFSETDYIIVGLCYRSNNAGKTEVTEMFECIKLASKMEQPMLIMGDFNYPGINWSTNESDSKGNTFLKLVCDYRLKQHITEATRMNNTLDLVLTNELLVIDKKDIEIKRPLKQCDHKIILILKIKHRGV